MALPTIGSLWVGKELSWLEQLCLKSFVDHGHDTVLYTYDEVKGIPEGVRVADANDVLPAENIIRHAKTGSPAYHADVFRLHMLKKTDNVWADTDAFCVQPWDVRKGTHFHGWISDKVAQVNNGVLRLPKSSKTLAAMLKFTSDEYPIPPWLRPEKQAELAAAKERGEGVHVSLLPWGVWGPDALTWFLKETGEIKSSLPGHVIYPVPFKIAGAPLNPNRVNQVRAMIKEDTLSIHFWGRRFRNIAAKRGGVPEEGSYVHELLRKHGIDPEPTRHLMVVRRPGEAPSETKGGDTPTFDTAQILQALDLDDVGHVADINGGAPELAIKLHERFGSTIDLLIVDDKGKLTPDTTGVAARYLSTLEDAGVERDAVRVISDDKDMRTCDVVIAIDSFGCRHKIQDIKPILNKTLQGNSRLVMEIRKGSGSYPFLRAYGGSNTLVEPSKAANGLVVMSVEPQDDEGSAGDWSKVARELAGPDGFFTDLGEHSFVYIPRGDTLVVTFDNLDIAMEKRDDRRPWGFGFIEAQGWSMLGVMANGWTWFRADEVEQKFIELRDTGFFDQFKRVVFYGASMGAYGAAAFSAAAPGSTVFAISPQSTLDKIIVPWEMRYKKAWARDFSSPFGDAALSSQAAAEVNILFDPYVEADAAHARRFTGDNVTFWRCPLLGHRLGSSLHQMGVLQEIARRIIDGDLTPNQFHRLLRQRHKFPRYQRELANLALERGHTGLARRVCEHVLSQRDDRYFRKMLARI